MINKNYFIIVEQYAIHKNIDILNWSYFNKNWIVLNNDSCKNLFQIFFKLI